MTWTTVYIFGLTFFIGSISAVKHSKIVDGVNAEIEDFPYVVSIRMLGVDFCGGSIISAKHILTAAHCMNQFNKDHLRIHSGTSRTNEKGNVHKILSIHTHPKWGANDEEDYSNNIAVVTLENPIVFDNHQQKINLPSHDVPSHKPAYVLGWGSSTNRNRMNLIQLQKLRVALLPSDECQLYIESKINRKQLCTYNLLNTGICYGDPGAPLVSNGEIVGIASFMDRKECASAIVNDIYTNVFAYKDFIESVINDN